MLFDRKIKQNENLKIEIISWIIKFIFHNLKNVHIQHVYFNYFNNNQ